jgi:hypothetical protein
MNYKGEEQLMRADGVVWQVLVWVLRMNEATEFPCPSPQLRQPYTGENTEAHTHTRLSS